MNHTTHLDPPNSTLRVSDALFMSLEAQPRQKEIIVISGSPKQLRKQYEKFRFGLVGHLRLHICITGLRIKCPHRVYLRLFSENDHHSHLRGSVRSQEPLTLPQNSIGRHCGDVRPDWAVRVDSIILEPNDHHSHLRGSVRSQEPLTLPQNSIGSLCGDVRPDLCQSGLFSFQPGLLRLFGSVQGQNSPNPTQQRSNPTFCSPIPYLRIRYDHSRLR
ncbi:hypothetical protein CRG98_031014 [Punica granatum]|uniref:Uncharacterized protein n=1 Tax=Punica granatum TaxID=22663 RepID=A0A2I0IXE3_PUNGR|nr:hypothetical protein CRG98_031014 [Punica granatum]